MNKRLICFGLFCGLLPLCAGAANSTHAYLEWMQSGITLVVTVPAGPVNNGLVYDHLRLEFAQP